MFDARPPLFAGKAMRQKMLVSIFSIVLLGLLLPLGAVIYAQVSDAVATNIIYISVMEWVSSK